MKELIFIIGSNSFSGSSFIDYLLSKGHIVVGVSRQKEKKVLAKYNENKLKKNFTFKQIDINKNHKKLIKIINHYKPKIIINYSALGMVNESWEYPDHWFKTNTVSFSKIIKEISSYKFIKKFINFSTPEVYGDTLKIVDENNNFNPSTPYAISRAAADIYLKKISNLKGFPSIITRTSNVYGPHQDLHRVIPRTIINLMSEKKIELDGQGEIIRSFIHIEDVNKALYKILYKGKIGETYHISTDEFVTIKKLCFQIAKILKLKNYKVIHRKERLGKDKRYKLGIKKIKKLNWRYQISIKDGLKDTVQWYIKNFNILKKKNVNYIHKK
ncbi:GDP-mannose 4,6-dehydratase [Candidatus Pelagibacter sp.]|nr:GDP-mannose 4,6-dehydratase [Candidatus Pelagibacter sp.]